MEALRQIGERTPDVDAGNAEQRLRGRCEKPDVEGGIEEQRCHVRAVQDILQVRPGGALLLQALLELGVKRRQFLVEGLKFLLRGLQLLIGRLELLVYGKGFFVDGPEVFIRISRSRIRALSSLCVASSSCSSWRTREVSSGGAFVSNAHGQRRGGIDKTD